MEIKNENIVAAGGCFPAGTKINTPIGYRLIEDLKAGDEVFAFTLAPLEAGMPDEQPGRTFTKTITETFKHTFGEVGYTSPLLEITYHGIAEHGAIHDGLLLVTGNHYILTPSRQSAETDPGFARADELQVGDKLWTEYGDAVEIVAITPAGEYDFVYNFEVADFSTYIASGIRVHNGGSGKKQRTPVQAPNSVRTKQVIRALFCPGEGESGGLFNSTDIAQSVYFDGTPLKNSDGTYNFNNISVEQRVGLPDQSIINGFSAVEGEVLLGLPITAATPATRTVSSGAIDAVRITIEFPQGLQKIDKKTGDANGATVNFVIQRRVVNGTWETVISPIVTEMSSGPFTAAFHIARPASTGPWEFRVQRTTPDTTANEIIDDTVLDSYTEIQDVKLPYNNRSLVAITVGADSTNGKIPSVAFDWVGVKVKVPSNYNATTRVYTGAWNGTWSTTLVSSDNPAWVIYDLLTHTRYGQGERFKESQLDKWSFYEAAKYCDELVNDGKGTGTFEPRFTFNAQLMVRENAWKTLNTIAATMNAKLYMHAGFVRVAQDRPATPTRIIANSNALEGLFSYSSSSVDETYTMCNVTYNDPLDNFLPKTVSEVAATADLTRYGLSSVDLAAYGATTEGQARRAAKWVIDTSLRQTSMVNFGVSLENAAFEPNEIFYLMDSDYSQTTQEGRLANIAGTSLTLDKSINKTGTGTWTITVYAADGNTMETRTITSANGVSANITVNAAITSVKGAVYIITGSVSPRQFRMVGMTDNGDLTYTVTALQHDPNKYARIEQGIILPDDVYWQPPSLNSVNVPTGLVIEPQSAINEDGQVFRFLNLSWNPPADGTAQRYTVQWRRNLQPFTIETVKDPFARITSDFSGSYQFYINAVNSANVASPTLSGTYVFEFTGVGSPVSVLGPVSALQIAGGGTIWDGGIMRVQWLAPTEIAGATLKDYKVELQTPGGAVFKTFYTNDVGFAYTYEQNLADGGPRTTIRVNVYARDTLNRVSTQTTSTFSSQAPQTITNLQVRGTGGTVFTTLDLDVEWTANTVGGQPWKNDPNFGYFKVEILSGTTVRRTDQVYDNNYVYTYADNIKDNGAETPLTSIIVRVSVVTKAGLAGPSGSATFTPAAPPQPTNLQLVGGGTAISTEDISVEWTALSNGSAYHTLDLFKFYKVEVLVGTTVMRTVNVTDGARYTYRFDDNMKDNGLGTPSGNITIRVTTVSKFGVSSAPTSTLFTVKVPPTVTNLTMKGGGSTYAGEDLEVVWDCLDENGKQFETYTAFKHYRVIVYKGAGTTPLRTELVRVRNFVYSLAMNQIDNGGTAMNNPTIEVVGVNTFNVIGAEAQINFSNPPPSAPVIDCEAGVEMVFVDVVPNTADKDVIGIEVHVSQTAGFTPSGNTAGVGTCVYKGNGTSYSFKATPGTYYVRVACYDMFNTTGLNYSAQAIVVVAAPITSTDYEFLGFTWTPNSPTTNSIGWTSGTVQKRAGASGVGTTWNVTAGSAAWSSASLYIYWDANVTPTTFKSTTDLAIATGIDKRIVALYKGGTQLFSTDGNRLIDASTTIIPNTISAPLLVTGAAVITGTAQIADLIVTDAKLANLTVTAAKIANAAITNAKIGNAQIDTLKLTNGAVNDIKTVVTYPYSNYYNIGFNTTDNYSVYSSPWATPAPAGLPGPFKQTVLIQLLMPRVIFFQTMCIHTVFAYVEFFDGASWFSGPGLRGNKTVVNPAATNATYTSGNDANEFYQITHDATPGMQYRIRFDITFHQTMTSTPPPYTTSARFDHTNTVTAITQMK